MDTFSFRSVDSIIFDLDGTLWDTSATCTRAWNLALADSGYGDHVLDEDLIRSFSGLRIEKILHEFFSFIPDRHHADLLTRYQKNEQQMIPKFGGRLYPGVEQGLPLLRSGFDLFIVSNCLRGYIENFLGFTKLQDLFKDFESSGNTGLSKSENIRAISSRNRLIHPMYVGDTLWDLDAAANNNIPFLYASYGFGHIAGPVSKIDHFDELLQLAGKTPSAGNVA